MSTEHPHIRPVPPTLADTVSLITADIDDDELAWTVARLAEVAYAEGYQNGHTRGRQEARDRAAARRRRESQAPS